MNPAQLRTAKNFVQAATDNADSLADGPRWTMFAIDDFLVAGVVAEAPWFSRDLTHELKVNPDGSEQAQRELFAFVGAVFDSPYNLAFVPPSNKDKTFYEDVYERVVRPRFFERMSTPTWHKATEFSFDRPITLPIVNCSKPSAKEQSKIELCPVSELEELWMETAAGRGYPSLCSNVPLGKSNKQWHTFDRVTRKDIYIRRIEARELVPKPSATSSSEPRKQQIAPEMDPASFREREKGQKKTFSIGSGSLNPFLVAVGVAIFVAIAVTVIRLR
jgi:hypothetical protein